MRSVVRFDLDEALPLQEEVLEAQGLPRSASLPAPVRRAVLDAFETLRALAMPVGVFEDVLAEDFQAIYAGEGCNPPESPLPSVVPKAQALALYAGTVGEPVGARIAQLLGERDLAVAYLLDTVASATADRLSHLLALRFAMSLRERGLSRHSTRVLPYSPGYCGWHVSGQGKLFERLRPQDVGIHLNRSFFMTPLKSVSGVLVAGPAEAHRFRPDFAFCDACVTHECRQRMAEVLRPA